MNNFPRQALSRIVAKYGKAIGGDRRRCEGLLNDLAGEYRREVNVLVEAIEERVPLDLLAASGALPPELLLTRLEKQLENQTALTPDAARWAVESWALALGVVTDAQLEERRRRALSKTETNSQLEPENKSSNQKGSTVNRPAQSQKTQNPASRPPLAPPLNTPPPKMPPPAAPAPRNNQPPVGSPRANPSTQPSTSAPVSKSRFGFVRGCLIAIFLLAVASVVLLFGVPYAIEVMRETQRERNNEPPRFPVR